MNYRYQKNRLMSSDLFSRNDMKIFRKLYPFFLAVISYNIVRLVTDIPNNDTFWVGGIRQHLLSLFSLTLIYYLYDFLIRLSIKKRWFIRKSRFDEVKEYVVIILQQLIIGNLFLYLGGKTGVFYFGNPVRDYIIANVVCIPILTFYYTAINREKIESEYREQALMLGKIKVEKLENELLLLRSQYHPHFLFNALNTVYFQIESKNQTAKQSIERLSDLLRYQLYDIEKEVTLEQEINYMQTYIEFQKQRMPDCLKLQLDLDVKKKEQKIQPLLFQPLLENAFKYTGGEYWIGIEMKQNNTELVFKIINSTPEEEKIHSKKGGIGLTNLKKRLDLLYPDKYVLQTEQSKNLFQVLLTLNFT